MISEAHVPGNHHPILSAAAAADCARQMYQALYRKYRPLTFEDVVGQEHITSTLKRQVQTGRLSHAYLFSGTRGTGKTTCARILARAVNCEHPVNGDPCNQCASCRGILDESVMDVVEMDAASHSGVDDVRALREEAVFSPASVKKRVYIIDEAHALASSSMSFNALLKILEEPPEHVIFILCTTDPQKLPPTIVSRCQRHSFTRIEPAAIAERLRYVAGQEGIELEPEAAELLSRLADGGLRDALSLLDQCSASEHIGTAEVLSAMGLAGSRRTVELLDAIGAGDAEKALTLFSRLWQGGKEPAGILNELGGLMRDVLLLQVAPRNGEALLSGIYETQTLRRFASQLTGSQLMDGMSAIRAANVGGTDPRRAAEMCLVRLCVPETGDTLAGLKTRVSRLEAALKSGAAIPAPAAVPVPEPIPAAEPAAGPAPAPAPPEPPQQEDEAPWYTDADAPPEDTDDILPPAHDPEPPAKQEPKPPERPSPASPAPDGGAVWDALVRGLNGKLDMGAYAILMTPTQVTGSYDGDTLSVVFATPIAKMMLDNPTNQALFQQELQAVTGKSGHVAFIDRPPAETPKPNMEKLDALGRFGNIKFE